MKKFFILLFLITPLSLCAQKTKTKEISRNYSVSLSEYIKYDIDNILIDTSYTMYGRDARYKQLVEVFRIKTGTLSEMYFFLSSVKEFLKVEEEGTSTDINKVHISVERTTGIKHITVWCPSEYGNGYTEITAAQITKVMEAILYHCERNGLKLRKPKTE